MGCGACAAACPNGAIRLTDVLDAGIRPVVDPQKCRECGQCVLICPGVRIAHQVSDQKTIPQLRRSWGPVLEVWEGYATDPEIHFKGSSGGAATALALYCLERAQMSGVLHIGARPEAPVRNAAVFSTTKEELLARTGSRYSPAAPCEKFDWIQQAARSSVFIGKPCDVVALRKSQAVNSPLEKKTGLAISIFCAGTPATKGTLKLLDVLGVKAEDVEELRYRGCGWPGATTVKLKGGNGQMRQMTYGESWGSVLCNYTQFRCRLCPDSTGEFADISCGDPWYRPVEAGEEGWSLVLVRTERGRDILHGAMKADYVKLDRVAPDTVPQSQESLLIRRRHLWGRLLTMRMMRIPVPHYTGFSLFKNWLELPFVEKLRSIGGTLTRIVLRRWFRPLSLPAGGDGMQQADQVGRA